MDVLACQIYDAYKEKGSNCEISWPMAQVISFVSAALGAWDADSEGHSQARVTLHVGQTVLIMFLLSIYINYKNSR